MSEQSEWYAHTEPYLSGPWHLLKDHALSVSNLASRFAAPFGMAAEGGAAGILHDLGKYGALFQDRLRGTESGIDHWTVGANVALMKLRSVPIALAIQGHHLGLGSAVEPELRKLSRLEPDGDRRLSDPNPEVLLARQAADGVGLPQVESYRALRGADVMLRTRMLFSALVDADFLDTESHFARRAGQPKRIRAAGPDLDVDRSIQALNEFKAKLPTSAVAWVRKMREETFAACHDAASLQPGLFTLTAPTGSGKTLAMLEFALQHAQKHGLRRIVIVLPFLTLIEQTANIYRDIFAGFGEDYVLEDHSLANDTGDKTRPGNRAKLLAENWDAPIIITTNVRFFEALHHNRPSACRKLHRLAKTVILCDEVQSLPLDVPPPASLKDVLTTAQMKDNLNLITPTLATTVSLVKDYGSTVVFATATQPAFPNFQDSVTQLCPHTWAPTEIIPDVNRLFANSARVATEWRTAPETWEQLADEISTQPGTLVIVNTRRAAVNLTELLKARLPNAQVLHLSTNLCVAHRTQVLARVKAQQVEANGFLVATQCVEAGVDLDFRQVYRAWAPLDSIAQAAGRCNRNGRSAVGRFVVFEPEAAQYPLGGYRQAVQVSKNTVQQEATGCAELHDPQLFHRYFESLFDATGITQRRTAIEERIEIGDYKTVAEMYRLIPNSGDNIVIRVGDSLGRIEGERNELLLTELERTQLTGKLMRNLRPYTVSTFRNVTEGLPVTQLRTPDGEKISGWYLLDEPRYYDQVLGLRSDGPPDVLITN